MTTAIAGSSLDNLPQEEKAALRHAMLSVYYLSVGSQLESRGAPVMAVPPEVRPMPLDAALEKLKDYDDLRWDAYWRIVRSVPVEGWKRPRPERRYPQALIDELGPAVTELDELRRHARLRAPFFTAALLACAEGKKDEAIALAGMLEDSDGIQLERDDPDDLNMEVAGRNVVDDLRDATQAVLGKTALDYVTCLAASEDAQERTRKELRSLQAQVGLGLGEFIQDFYDTVAFQSFRAKQGGPGTMLISSCIVRQDTNTLTTTATVTTLATATLEQLSAVIDPLAWPQNSDVIKDTYYVADPWDPHTRGPQGKGVFDEPRHLFENVAVGFGFDEDVHSGGFTNVLTIGKFTQGQLDGITLPFRLCRSIDSRIFWDSRAGGILIDGGFIKARPVLVGSPADKGEVVPITNRWRVTTRKVLRFSDRTPYASAPGFLDFGQMLNFLVPAAVTLWLETDFYGAEPLHHANGERDG